MINLKLAFRSLLRKGQNNIIKILSLGIGLAVGFMLISKVDFELNYDNFYPDNERIYQVFGTYSEDKEEEAEDLGNPRVSGAIAPGMKMEIPEVEAATRFTAINTNGVFLTEDKKRYSGSFILADSCLFDVLPRPMIVGSAKQTLSQPMCALVSRSIADKMGGDVVGRQIRLDDYPANEITIGGVFEDIPQNSSDRYDVIISLSSISKFMGDGSMNWLGNDRYSAYVKLTEGTNPSSLSGAIRRMQQKHQDIERIEQEEGASMGYKLYLLPELHSSSKEVQRMTLLLSALAFALIFTAVMNYLLIVISTLIGRTKTVAVYKCYGATRRDIMKVMFSETLLHLLISLALAALLILCFKGMFEDILSTSLSGLVTLRSGVLLLVVCVAVFLIAAIAPSYMLSNIPVASVFRSFKKSRRGWKLILLFVQFTATAFLVTLLVIVGLQYNTMVNDNPGYSYQNVLHTNMRGTSYQERQTAIDRLIQNPNVGIVATAANLPFEGVAGNNIYLPGDNKMLFNAADLEGIDANYFELMEMDIIEGRGFDKTSSKSSDMLVNESFAERIKYLGGWEDGVVGKELYVTGDHGELSSIVGIFSDIRIGTIAEQDTRPAMFFYDPENANEILVKLKSLNGENIRQVYDILKVSFPEKDVVLTPYVDSMIEIYRDEHKFRNTILIGGIITIIISLIGLIGYVNNELSRRSGEIAVRRVNGAAHRDILALITKDILWIALPALVMGCSLAFISARKWMENFSEKTALTPWLFIGCCIFVLCVILSVAILTCLKINNQNPIVVLKNE